MFLGLVPTRKFGDVKFDSLSRSVLCLASQYCTTSPKDSSHVFMLWNGLVDTNSSIMCIERMNTSVLPDVRFLVPDSAFP